MQEYLHSPIFFCTFARYFAEFGMNIADAVVVKYKNIIL